MLLEVLECRTKVVDFLSGDHFVNLVRQRAIRRLALFLTLMFTLGNKKRLGHSTGLSKPFFVQPKATPHGPREWGRGCTFMNKS